MDFTKIKKKNHTSKNSHKRVQDTQLAESICNHISAKGLESRIYRDLQINNKANNRNKQQRKDLKRCCYGLSHIPNPNFFPLFIDSFAVSKIITTFFWKNQQTDYKIHKGVQRMQSSPKALNLISRYYPE